MGPSASECCCWYCGDGVPVEEHDGYPTCERCAEAFAETLPPPVTVPFSGPKQCGCGRAHSVAQWAVLPLCGRQDDGVDVLELRNCACGSTLAIVLATRGCDAA